MSTWDTNDLIARLRYIIGRPTTDEALSSDRAYLVLSEAQDRVMEDVATHCPWLNYGAPELMTSSDSGYTYTVAYDALGHMEVYPRLNAPPMSCGAFWDTSKDYCLDGPKTIRMTGNRQRTFDSGPYARYVRADLPILSASQNPILKPDRARMLIVYRAAAIWAERGGKRNPEPFERLYANTAWGNPKTGSVGLLTAEKNKVFGQGAEAYSDGVGGWWNSGDLG